MAEGSPFSSNAVSAERQNPAVTRREDLARFLAVNVVDFRADARDVGGRHARRINGDIPHFLGKGDAAEIMR